MNTTLYLLGIKKGLQIASKLAHDAPEIDLIEFDINQALKVIEITLNATELMEKADKQYEMQRGCITPPPIKPTYIDPYPDLPFATPVRPSTGDPLPSEPCTTCKCDNG
jgi:hypothetical protein